MKRASDQSPLSASVPESIDPLRVLFLIDSLVSGGKERQLVELVKGLAAREDVEAQLVVFSETVEYREVMNLRVPVRCLPRRAGQDLRVLGKLLRLAREFRPQVIHSWELMCSVYAIPVKIAVKAKLVNGTVRNAPERIEPFRKLWLRHHLTAPFSDVILGNSHAGLRAYNVPPAKARCIYNGFDFRRVHHLSGIEEMRGELGITTARVVGMVGNFSEKKDQPTLIRAAHEVLSGNRDVTFLLVGEGENLDQCKQIARGEPNIRFLGRRNNVESIVNLFDVGVLATFTEGISNSLMEYMALGKPVVATRGGGTEELVADGQTGFLVTQRDASSLADRIRYLLDHPNERTQMGEKGKRRIENEFDLKTMTGNFMALYRQCVSM